jgi:hypothetical protein
MCHNGSVRSALGSNLRSMTARVARGIVAVIVVVCALLPAIAMADGDPASDVLLGVNVFYPYMPPVSGSLQAALNAETAAASKAHFPIKVALIASPVDLGVIPSLFNKPQQYADFLDQEISFQGKQLLLVVMPAGYGVQGIGVPATAAAANLAKPTGTNSNDLAQAAITAVAKLARAAGHPIAAPSAGAGTSNGGSGGISTTTIILVALIVAAILATAALVTLRMANDSVKGI